MVRALKPSDGRSARNPYAASSSPLGAQVGGPIGLIQDGDEVSIDIPNRKLSVRLSAAEMARRRKRWKPAVKRKLEGYLARYAKSVGDASLGARLLVSRMLPFS